MSVNACVINCLTSRNLFHIVVPEGLSPPRLSSPSPRKVVVSWDEPSVTNGKIAFYVIERRVKGQALPVNVSQIAASLPRRFTDTVQPVTTYEYRIVAYTSVGGTPGPYTNITTAEGGNILV